MTIQTEYNFTEEDIRLLQKDLPESPCEKCGQGAWTCGGCLQRSEYSERISPYMKNNIFDFARMLTNIRKNRKIIREKQEEIDKQIKELPEEIKFLSTES